jgi:hypothetical protein
MGSICCCRKETEEYRNVEERKKIVQDDVTIYDYSGIAQGVTIEELAEDFCGFKVSSLQVIRRRSKHSNVRLIFHRKGKSLVVHVKYKSNGKFRVEISTFIESDEDDLEISGIEYISLFSKESKSEEKVPTLQDFLQWFLKNNEHFDDLLQLEKNMGKVIQSFFKIPKTSTHI